MSIVHQKGQESIQGVGVGLRAPHYQFIERAKPQIPWFEILVDNYLGKGGAALQHLERVRQDYPITFHGVGMSLGSTDPLNMTYLERLKALIERFEPVHVSDHLCWISVDGHYAHDLLPLPYIPETVTHVAQRIRRVQELLGQRIAIENVSTYLGYKSSVMEEWEFLTQVVEQADCDILLDVNNIYVSAYNHGFEPMTYLESVPADRVREFHLAGYEDQGTHLLDTHGTAVRAPVWDLYHEALSHFGPVPTLIEWDNNIPEFNILQAEADKAMALMSEVCRDVA